MSIAPIISKLLTFISTVYIIRNLPVTEYGIYVTVCTFVGLFVVAIDAGLNTLATREIARDHAIANRCFVNVVVLRSILAVLVFLLTNLVAYFLNYEPLTRSYILLFSLFLLTHGMFESYIFVFNGLERMEYNALVTIAFSLLANGAYCLAIYLGYGIRPLFIIPIVVSVCTGFAMYVLIVRNLISFKLEFDFPFALSLLKDSWPFAALAVFGMIYNKVDIIMLSKMSGAESVSYYGSAYKLINALFIFSSAYTVAIFPLFSQLSVNSAEKLFFTYKLSFKIMAAVAFPVVACVSLLSNEIIVLFFKTNYLAAAAPLRILVWSVLLIYFTTVIQCIMYSFNRQKMVAAVLGCTTILNIVLNLALIPRYSYLGASISTIICEAFNLIVYYYLISKTLPRLPWSAVFLKPLIATAILSGSLILLKPMVIADIYLYLLPVMAIAMIVYGLVYRQMKPFNASEIEQLERIPIIRLII